MSRNDLLFYVCLFALMCWTSSCNHNSNRRPKAPFAEGKTSVKYLSMQPVEGEINKQISEEICAEINRYYGFAVIVNKGISLPKSYRNLEKGLRYSADSILKLQEQLKPDSIAIMVGITEQDIYTTKTDENGHIKSPESKYRVWGIFGLGRMPGSSCIISLRRLHCADAQKYRQRVEKVVLHEIGHNLGLPHCPNKRCFMGDAVESISTVDQESLELCTDCKHKLGG